MTDDRPLLALDTSGIAARVALVARDGRILAQAERTALRHSSNLLVLCDEILRAVGVKPAALAAIACGAGPGSFTGLRVGLAAAKGLALPWDTPFVLVSSLQALADDLLVAARAAKAISDPDARLVVVPCIDAGKGEIHARRFTAGHDPGGSVAQGDPWRMSAQALCDHLHAPAGADPIGTPEIPPAAAATRLVFGGTGIDRYPGVFERAFPDALRLVPSPGPSGAAVARLAWARLDRGERDDLATATPFYGRAPDITSPRIR